MLIWGAAPLEHGVQNKIKLVQVHFIVEFFLCKFMDLSSHLNLKRALFEQVLIAIGNICNVVFYTSRYYINLSDFFSQTNDAISHLFIK